MYDIQVLSDYPEAKMTNEQQYASLGESHADLVNRLEEGIVLLVYTVVQIFMGFIL